MKCLLLLVAERNTISARASRWTDCLKEECAWWDRHCSGCVLLGIRDVLLGLWEKLSSIEKEGR